MLASARILDNWPQKKWNIQELIFSLAETEFTKYLNSFNKPKPRMTGLEPIKTLSLSHMHILINAMAISVTLLDHNYILNYKGNQK